MTWQPATVNPPPFEPLLLALVGGEYFTGYIDPFGHYHVFDVTKRDYVYQIDRELVIGWIEVKPCLLPK